MERRIVDAIKSELVHIGDLMDRREYSPVFNMAGLVFENVLVNFKDAPKDPKDYILDYYFKASGYEFSAFCDDFAAAVYESLEVPLMKRARDTKKIEDYLKWNKFSGVFNCAKFSEILQENLLTKNCVDSFEKYGEKIVMIKCHRYMWAYANFYAPQWIRKYVRTN